MPEPRRAHLGHGVTDAEGPGEPGHVLLRVVAEDAGKSLRVGPGAKSIGGEMGVRSGLHRALLGTVLREYLTLRVRRPSCSCQFSAEWRVRLHRTGAEIVKGVKMGRALIGRTIRRLRSERGLTQQALAARLGISASYLNLIEHDQRAVTASLLIKLGETLRVDLAALSGTEERQLEASLRETFADPMLGAEPVAEPEIAAWSPRPRMPRARSWGCIAAGGSRARTPAASRCRPAGVFCCRPRRSATSSTTARTTFPSWRSPPRRSPPIWR